MEQLSISVFLVNWPECDISNKPLEWTGLQKYLAPVLNPFLPLRGSVGRIFTRLRRAQDDKNLAIATWCTNPTCKIRYIPRCLHTEENHYI
jgi:hypothetical protein